MFYFVINTCFHFTSQIYPNSLIAAIKQITICFPIRLSIPFSKRSLRQFQGDRHEAYVRITLNHHYRTVKEKRTGVAKTRNGAVTFTEAFNFKISPGHVDESNLSFHVFQATSGYGRGRCWFVSSLAFLNL